MPSYLDPSFTSKVKVKYQYSYHYNNSRVARQCSVRSLTILLQSLQSLWPRSSLAKYGILATPSVNCIERFQIDVFGSDSDSANILLHSWDGTNSEIPNSKFQMPHKFRGRNISYDRLYLIPMAQWLLDRGITSVGTYNQIKKESQLILKESKTEKQPSKQTGRPYGRLWWATS